MDTSRLIVGMTGFAGSGKDTFAERLTGQHGFVRDAIADDIRAAALLLDPLIPYEPSGRLARLGRRLNLPPRPRVMRLSELVDAIDWHDAKRNPEVRRVLQVLGSEVGWMMHGELLWVNRVQERIDALPPGTPAVVTDVRFPVEREWLRDKGGVLVHVVRPGHTITDSSTSGHVSEIHTSDLSPDIVVVNDTTIADLHAKADRLIDQLYELSGLSSHFG